MGKKPSLSNSERQKITQLLAEGKSAHDIGRVLQRDARTIKKAVENITFKRKTRKDMGQSMFSERDLRKIKIAAKKMPLHSSKTIFESAGVASVSRETRCRILRKVAKVKKPKAKPILTKRHKMQRMVWAKKYLKQDFSKVIFTDECRASLDGPDGWSKGWIVEGQDIPFRLRRQQGGGGVMFWAAIVGNSLVGPFRVADGVKMNSQSYTEFLDANFFPWYESKTMDFQESCVFMQDNAPSHASRFTKAYLAGKNISGERLMDWPPSSPDLNCIENLWSIVKKEIYRGNKQYTSKDDLWKVISEACKNIKRSVISNLTSSMDDRLVRVLEGKGAHVDM